MVGPLELVGKDIKVLQRLLSREVLHLLRRGIEVDGVRRALPVVSGRHTYIYISTSLPQQQMNGEVKAVPVLPQNPEPFELAEVLVEEGCVPGHVAQVRGSIVGLTGIERCEQSQHDSASQSGPVEGGETN